ncbi:hypothetical protein [Jannaschia sp. CCS1]|uniref:hypothetical protein n=1 Tax=Jannaschia sp. (strain CCS1) TaxID=290400 RepID=UPI000053BBB7|nr:hypothetical protein [Jannaschia sp. CCS1]ABD56828.1 hypothetical protein Jann_3911 [Jannaschia sp. CCS1]
MSAPRLHVIPATGCDLALVLRRGPSRQVASLLWDRRGGELRLGQWLNGRIYEFRCDLSPDGKHMIVFAGNGRKWWTAISRAPFLTALTYLPQDHTWHGGGAFDADGRVFFNGGHGPKTLPDGLQAANDAAFPHGTDGFHMGGLYAARMVLRGWHDCGGQGYDMVLEKPIAFDWTLRQTVAQGATNRGLISTQYTMCRGATEIATDWEWAEPWSEGVQIARQGGLWHVPVREDAPGTPDLICDLTDMTFEPQKAPYEGISA